MSRPIVAVVVGTRPEAIKMAPVVRALERQNTIEVRVISTGQHREMLDQVLGRFQIAVDRELNLMEPDQTLFRLSSKALLAFEQVLADVKPSLLLVQGDTTTAFFGALSAFYRKVPVGHVEAGLRTDNPYSPFPEEINRRLISVVAALHFAPSLANRDRLVHEGVAPGCVFVTGNTVIDALFDAVKLGSEPPPLPRALERRRLVLVTVHRRESFGLPLEGIFWALRDLAEAYRDIVIVYPVHLNPNVQRPAHEILGSIENVLLTPPVDYFGFVTLMSRAHLILTDSGGIQEEAPSLGVPVLVLRNETERQEAIAAGTVRLAGTSRETIVAEARRLLDDGAAWRAMSQASNPYGDGHAAERIAEQVVEFLKR